MAGPIVAWQKRNMAEMWPAELVMAFSRRQFLASTVAFSASRVANASPVDNLLSLFSKISPQGLPADYERLSFESLLDGSASNSLVSTSVVSQRYNSIFSQVIDKM